MRGRQARCYIKTNNIVKHITRIDNNIKSRTDEMAKYGAKLASADIGNRAWFSKRNSKPNLRPFGTRANENSFYYILTNDESNYDAIKSDFEGRIGGVKHYGGRPNADLVFPQHVIDRPEGQYVSSYGTLSVILAFWEYGHYNRFTRRRERRPTISYTLFTVRDRFKEIYKNIGQ